MKLLYVGRIFSGLEASLLSGKWEPTGVPTIYKLIEALDRSSHDVRFVLADQAVSDKFRDEWRHDSCADVRLDGLGRSVTVMPGIASGIRAGRLRRKVDHALQTAKIVRLIREFDPDVVYVDRSNVLAGAVAARYLGRRVVLRVMGIYPSMWEILFGRTLFARLERWAYRSPFVFALCTEDGSDGRGWMDAALSSSVPRCAMLNGVAVAERGEQPFPPVLDRLPKDKLIVMFIGRVEDIKGWREFAEGILKVAPDKRSRLHAVMIGTGADRDRLAALIRGAGASDDFTLIERIAHSQIHAVHAMADIYVSLNRLGNLSNANLECFRDGMCTILPTSDPANNVDVTTDCLIPPEAAIRIDRNRAAETLAETLERLVDDPAEIERRKVAMAGVAARILRSWDARITEEIELLETLAGGGDIGRWGKPAFAPGLHPSVRQI